MKRKKNNKKELNIKYQLLLLFNAQITRICMQHTGFLKNTDQNDLGATQITDFFLKFNIHAFTAYFDKYFLTKYELNLEKDNVFLEGWNKHMNDFLNPLFSEELKKLREKVGLVNKKTIKSYIS